MSNRKKTELPPEIRDKLPPELRDKLPKNVRIISLDELKRLATRLQKVTNFNFTGAILCMMAGIYYAEQGSQLLPKVFIGVMAFTLLMTILSYRANAKVSKMLEMVTRNKPKKPLKK